MLSRSHIASGLTTSLIILLVVDPDLKEFIPGIILGSITPDIDTSKSWISQSIPFLDDKLRRLSLLKHRGVTHGLTGIIAMILLYYFIRNDFTFGFALGYVIHCLFDSIFSVFVSTNTKVDKIQFKFFWCLNCILIGLNIYLKIRV